jgi:hypothetical protein
MNLERLRLKPNASEMSLQKWNTTMHKKDVEDDTMRSTPETVGQPSFWKSRTGISLIIFLSLAALLLGFEHRVHIFVGDGFLALLLLGCVVMHLFMHGGHGGHGGGDKS